MGPMWSEDRLHVMAGAGKAGSAVDVGPDARRGLVAAAWALQAPARCWKMDGGEAKHGICAAEPRRNWRCPQRPACCP